MNEWKWNPKTKGSGIITCIPQKGECPNQCDDCFFQSGRSYLEPLKENLPHIPDKTLAAGRIVRINDGNDSNNARDLVEMIARQYTDYFFNTAIPHRLEEFSGPVVLTGNPAEMTDKGFHRLKATPKNLMFVRIRVNAWNLDVVKSAVEYYTSAPDRQYPVVLTFMAYYTLPIPEQYKSFYEWKKRTLNSYWILKKEEREKIVNIYADAPLVYSCGYTCKFCGHCIREYYNAKERIRKGGDKT